MYQGLVRSDIQMARFWSPWEGDPNSQTALSYSSPSQKGFCFIPREGGRSGRLGKVMENIQLSLPLANGAPWTFASLSWNKSKEREGRTRRCGEGIAWLHMPVHPILPSLHSALSCFTPPFSVLLSLCPHHYITWSGGTRWNPSVELHPL